MKPNTYVGVDNDNNGGMTSVGKIIRDAKVFNLIEDSETCKGWDHGAIQNLLEKVNIEWDKYGCMVSNLPEDIFNRHQEIHNKALEQAHASGWTGEDELNDELNNGK